jgi:hypothetical protein
MTANNLASSLLGQGKNFEAEVIYWELLGMRKVVLGPEHPSTLATANNLARSLSGQGKHAEAERILGELLQVEKRVLGPEHPDTLKTAGNLAGTLFQQGKHADSEKMLHATLASSQRVLGPTHHATLGIASNLETVQANIRPKPHDAHALATAGVARLTRPLPAGTRVLLQRLVAKPEHNGERARVLSFDACSGRYGVALDNGTELSLKSEFVAQIGCAKCLSEEANIACARCQAVRYCSRECQRVDWNVHKPVCAAARRVWLQGLDWTP